LSGSLTLNSVEGVGSIQFGSLGAMTNTGNAVRNFDLCHPDYDGRRIRISLIGRASSYEPGEAIEPNC